MIWSNNTYSLESTLNWEKIYNNSNSENLEEINETSVAQNLQKFVEQKPNITNLVTKEYTVIIDYPVMEYQSIKKIRF